MAGVGDDKITVESLGRAYDARATLHRSVFGPGSPLCLQQLLRFRILIQLLRTSKQTLRSKAMGACKLVKNEVMLGRLPVTVRYSLVYPGSPDSQDRSSCGRKPT